MLLNSYSKYILMKKAFVVVGILIFLAVSAIAGASMLEKPKTVSVDMATISQDGWDIAAKKYETDKTVASSDDIVKKIVFDATDRKLVVSYAQNIFLNGDESQVVGALSCMKQYVPVTTTVKPTTTTLPLKTTTTLHIVDGNLIPVV
jgi:hypothetical protein